MKKVVLAFSGGLDTSFCIPYLAEQGYEVHAVAVDTGGFSPEDIRRMRARVRRLPAKELRVVNARQVFYSKLVSYVIKANVLRGDVYPLCVGPERIVQAEQVVRVARQLKADALAHGSTGAGNDQVRFDVAFRTLAPDLPVLTPIRDLNWSRGRETDYLKRHGLSVETVTRDYSINRGMLGTTIGGKETKSPWGLPPIVVPSIPRLIE
jgi:argininosuccinate synthase